MTVDADDFRVKNVAIFIANAIELNPTNPQAKEGMNE